ncbi:MAG TPA: hypothetical protein VH134_18060 [Candidatus Dormibacteraeota bacterium]|jgi:hypothetical protein|nr:hypothetical protein [Candidatus Dormibacteraeota bacterium]
MRRLRILAACALLLSAALATTATPARAQGGAVCTFAASFRVLPGFTTTPTRGTFTTGGETGTIECVGAIFGQAILGAGTFGFEGEYGTGPSGGDTCSDGVGRGTYSMHVPTSLGVVHATGTFTESFLGNAGQMVGSGPVMEISCLYQFHPTEGDCVTTPARAETLTGQGAVIG